MKPKISLKHIGAISASLAISAFTLSGQPFVWTGAGGNQNFGANANWVGDAPANNEPAAVYVFDIANMTDPDGDEPWRPNMNRTGLTFSGLTLAGSDPSWDTTWVGGWDLRGSNIFTLTGNINASGGSHRISTNEVVLGNNVEVNVANQSLAITSVISGAHSITQTGSGTLTMTAANTFTGGVNLNGGTLAVSNNNQLGTGGAVNLNGGVISWTGGNSNVARVFNIGASGGTVNVSNASSRFGIAASGSLAGSGNLTVTGPGTFYLNAVDDRTDGNIIVQSGTLEFSFANRIRSGSSITLNNGATLLNSLNQTGDNNLTSNTLILDSGVATLRNTGSSDNRFGTITGAGGLVVESTTSAAISFEGDSTFAGGVNLAQGMLLLNNSVGSATGSGAVSVASGALVGGSGRIGGDLELAAGAFFVFDPLTTLNVAGSVTLDDTFGVASLRGLDGAAIDWGTIADGTYTLIAETASSFGNISNLGLGEAFDIGGDRLAYFQQGSLQLVVIPEPQTYVLISGLLAIAFVLIRRRLK